MNTAFDVKDIQGNLKAAKGGLGSVFHMLCPRHEWPVRVIQRRCENPLHTFPEIRTRHRFGRASSRRERILGHKKCLL